MRSEVFFAEDTFLSDVVAKVFETASGIFGDSLPLFYDMYRNFSDSEENEAHYDCTLSFFFYRSKSESKSGDCLYEDGKPIHRLSLCLFG